jgi:hypothetical protein
MNLVSLNIHLDQINALARFEIIVERDHTGWNSAAGISFDIVRCRDAELKLPALAWGIRLQNREIRKTGEEQRSRCIPSEVRPDAL